MDSTNRGNDSKVVRLGNLSLRLFVCKVIVVKFIFDTLLQWFCYFFKEINVYKKCGGCKFFLQSLHKKKREKSSYPTDKANLRAQDNNKNITLKSTATI